MVLHSADAQDELWCDGWVDGGLKISRLNIFSDKLNVCLSCFQLALSKCVWPFWRKKAKKHWTRKKTGAFRLQSGGTATIGETHHATCSRQTPDRATQWLPAHGVTALLACKKRFSPIIFSITVRFRLLLLLQWWCWLFTYLKKNESNLKSAVGWMWTFNEREPFPCQTEAQKIKIKTPKKRSFLLEKIIPSKKSFWRTFFCRIWCFTP